MQLLASLGCGEKYLRTQPLGAQGGICKQNAQAQSKGVKRDDIDNPLPVARARKG